MSCCVVSCRVVPCCVVSCRVVPDGGMGSEPPSVTSESRHLARCILKATSAEMATGSSFNARKEEMRLTPTCSFIILR